MNGNLTIGDLSGLGVANFTAKSKW